jgi:GT2 family glycosyltransferase
MTKPLDLSVIIPTYKRPDYLAEALRKLLEVDALSMEIMVIDDSPEAEGQAVVAGIGDGRIKYSRRTIPTNGRPALLRNEAARTASGAVFYFLDDDDLVIPETLPGAYAELCKAPEGVLLTLPLPFGNNAVKVESEVTYYASARKVLARRPSAYELEARLTFASSFVVPSACMIKRGVFAKVGGFDETFAFCEDVDFFAKAIAYHGYVLSDATIVRRRVGHSSLIANAKTDALRWSYVQLRNGFRARHGLVALWANRIKYKLNDQ